MKHRRLLILCLALLTATMFAIPTVLTNSHVQERAVARISALLGQEGKIGKVGWRWLPLPGIVFNDLRLTTPAAVVTVPEAVYLPNPLTFILDRGSLGEIVLQSPRIRLRAAHPQKVPALPRLTITIHNGALTMPAGSLGGDLRHPPVTIDGLNGTATLQGQRFKFNARARTSFCATLAAIGRVDLHQGYYRLDLSATSLDLLKLIAGRDPSGICKPSSTNFDLRLHAEGLGAENWQIRIKAPKAGVTSLLSGHRLRVGGVDRLEISRFSDDYFVNIANLDIDGLARGINARLTSKKGGNGGEMEIGLQAADLDFAAVASLYKDLGAGNPHWSHLFTTLPRGRAQDLRLAYKGPVADLHDINRYRFSANARDVAIHLPGIGLDVDRAAGPIAIEGGLLTGHDLTAEIGADNHGNNGTLLMALGPDDHRFSLNLDLDVNAVRLRQVLSTAVHFQPFQDELSRITINKGRVRGHLALDGELHHLTTKVAVSDFTLQGTYDRLPQPLTIKGGRLRVEPHLVSWDGVDIATKAITLTKTHGTVRRGATGTEIHVAAAGGRLESGPLYDDFSVRTAHGPWTPAQALGPRLTAISGPLDLEDISLQGRWGDPSSWHYAATAKSDDLEIESPNLPPHTTLTGLKAMVTDHDMSFQARARLAGDELTIDGLFRHRHFANRRGVTTINGRVGEPLGRWLRKRAAKQARLLPVAPFVLRDFKILTAPDNTGLQLQGRIVAAPNSGKPVTVDLDINHHQDGGRYHITLKRGAREGRLNVTLTRGKGAKTLISWQGAADADSIRAVIGPNLLRAGAVEGTFSFLVPGGAKPARANGTLEAHGLRLHAGENFGNLIVDNAHIEGSGEELRIKGADIGFEEEPIHVSGTVRQTGQDHLGLDLDLAADTIHWTIIRRYLDLVNRTTREDPGTSPMRHALTGDIRFRIKEFLYPRPQRRRDADKLPPPPPPKPYRFSPLTGSAHYAGKNGITINFDASELCGMRFAGTWYSEETGKLPRYTVVKDDPEHPPLEDSLSCLFARHSLIEGPFTLKAKVRGSPGDWQDGFLVFASKKGIIRRMNLLSKIFSVINFTDLLTYTGDNGPGLPYNDMVFESHVEDNELMVDEAVLKGKGVNMSGRGEIDLDSLEGDLTFYVAPFKMVDSIINKIPIIRTVIGGRKKSVFTIPVAVEGPLDDPEVTAMDPASVGGATLDFIVDTLTSPVRIFLPEKKRTYELDDDDKTPEKKNKAPTHD